MTQRKLDAHLWDRDPDDYYTEPAWVGEAIFARESFVGEVYDPACGSGRLVRAARAAGLQAWGGDKVHRCVECDYVGDFLLWNGQVDNIACNLPFGIADAFIKHALNVVRRKVVMIVPARYTSSDKRSRWLETTPLCRNLDIVPRPSMPPGRVIEAGIAPGGGKQDFKVLVWEINYDGRPESGWLRKVARAPILEAAE